MSITDELRKYADRLSERARYGATIPSPLNPHSGAPIGPTRETEELYAIADRIDAEHERKVGCTADEWDYWEHTHVELPKDADGEIINVGDKLDGYNKTIEVMWLRLGSTGWWIIDKYGKSYACCDAFSHHHKSTIEDVLREFGEKYCDMVDGCAEESELFAEYAAKLQLKERE